MKEGMGRMGREEVATRGATVERVQRVGMEGGTRGAEVSSRAAEVVVGGGEVTWLSMVVEGLEEVV